MDDVMEYVFFDKGLAERFQAACIALGVQATLIADETPLGEAIFSVDLSDALAESVTEQVEELYEGLLFGEQAALIEGNNGMGAVADSCGIQIQLSAGGYTNIAIEPVIMTKLLSVLSTIELQLFLEQVADDIENPKMEPICSRVKIDTV
ncbi:MAG: hypothetical protein ISEC1_P0321 [Thiomicrorhabdus sp.]|nr:MAG: hypothetical protein ISEC1_P0321 [Thiomicrorhabdus sp.]